MDCYPRFKKSELAKQCLLAEMEGKPLPVQMDEKKTTPPAGDGVGIWKMHRVTSGSPPYRPRPSYIYMCQQELFRGRSLWDRLRPSAGVVPGTASSAQVEGSPKMEKKKSKSVCVCVCVCDMSAHAVVCDNVSVMVSVMMSV